MYSDLRDLRNLRDEANLKIHVGIFWYIKLSDALNNLYVYIVSAGTVLREFQQHYDTY